ncbi:hypothetical protein NLI96_g1136 [Meripilus lineatus]|uniref:26S proteasome non-ATPase regulatory subunit 10 n=1 Tax=Meripilus lineatus TaxID=2056292 RepID=A0AAD5YHU1_9APHY|nr:hypothetical protein NLI96_g1136 [Physisporinus lineatus]
MANFTIHSAALNRQTGLLRSLLSQDPSLRDSQDADGRTALHWAASSGSLEIVRYLLDQKAQVDVPDQSGWTPLHIAVSAGHEDIVRELVGAGSDIKKTNDKGLTPLHYAASKSRVDIGKLLVARGADINARDKANQTPLHRAATTGSTGFIKLLLEPPEGSPKTRLNTGDRVGNTPLHLAMESAHAEAACLLIEAGADRSRENVDGQTPEDVEGVGGLEQRRAKDNFVRRESQKHDNENYSHVLKSTLDTDGEVKIEQ